MPPICMTRWRWRRRWPSCTAMGASRATRGCGAAAAAGAHRAHSHAIAGGARQVGCASVWAGTSGGLPPWGGRQGGRASNYDMLASRQGDGTMSLGGKLCWLCVLLSALPTACVQQACEPKL
jgi:hypothetical protein